MIRTTPRRCHRRRAAAAAAAVCAATLLAGCASTGGTDAPAASGVRATAAGLIGATADAGDPVDGGTLRFAGYSMPSSLDPTKTQPSGATGGTEMASIYGLLVRYDAATDNYVPQLAESLEESPDRLTWTIGLREGVTFSDGTPLDADAVVASINRYNKNRGAQSQEWTDGVASLEATDARTVTIHLKQPWREFPALLTYGHGMILAPAAYADPSDFRPIGAGPFTVRSFAPAQQLDLAPRADYWDGAPHLQSLTFVAIQDDQPRLEALDTGGIQMTYLRDDEVIDKATADNPSYLTPVSLNGVLQINNRDGRPGADPRVRQAIGAAIDPAVISRRVHQGYGSPGSELFQSWSKWHTDQPGPAYDPDRARELVAQAKADGFDGKVTYVSVNQPSSQNIATATQAMLNQVGFDVNVEYTPTVTDMVRRLYVDHDFDLTFGAYSLADSIPYLRLSAALRAASSNNVLGYDDPRMETLLDEVQQAPDDAAEKAALGRVQQLVTEQVPFLPLSAGANLVAWNKDVHGAVPSNDGIMLLGKAWVTK